MNITHKNDYVIVAVSEREVNQFNQREHAAIPFDDEYDAITFAFKKGSGDLLRVIPDATRQGTLAWERLRDRARQHWRAQE